MAKLLTDTVIRSIHHPHPGKSRSPTTWTLRGSRCAWARLARRRSISSIAAPKTASRRASNSATIPRCRLLTRAIGLAGRVRLSRTASTRALTKSRKTSVASGTPWKPAWKPTDGHRTRFRRRARILLRAARRRAYGAGASASGTSRCTWHRPGGSIRWIMVTRDEVKALLARIEKKHGPVMANRVVETVRAMFNWLIEEGRVASNPAARVQSEHPERSRDRVLTDNELAAVWHACADLGEPFGAVHPHAGPHRAAAQRGSHDAAS